MLFLRNFNYVLITLIYSYVKTHYLTHQTFRTHQSIIKTLEKGLTFVRKLAIKIPERHHWGRSGVLLTLNYFTPFHNFSVLDFKQLNSFDICFHGSTGGWQDLTRSNKGNSVIFLISHTQWGVTLASLWLLT